MSLNSRYTRFLSVMAILVMLCSVLTGNGLSMAVCEQPGQGERCCNCSADKAAGIGVQQINPCCSPDFNTAPFTKSDMQFVGQDNLHTALSSSHVDIVSASGARGIMLGSYHLDVDHPAPIYLLTSSYLL